MAAPTRAGSAFFDSIMAHNPISYWRLGDTAGTTAADATGLNPGTYIGATLGHPGGIENDADTSARFQSFFTRTEFAHQSEYLLNEGTILFLFNEQDTVGDAALFSKDSVTGAGAPSMLDVLTSRDGRVHTRFSGRSDEHIAASPSLVQPNTWHFLTFTFGPQGMRLYLDGSLVASNPFTGGLTSNTNSIWLAASRSPNNIIPPKPEDQLVFLDEVAILNRALSATEVTDLDNVVPEPATALLIIAACVIRRRKTRSRAG